MAVPSVSPVAGCVFLSQREIRLVSAAGIGLRRARRMPGVRLESVLAQLAHQVRQIGAQGIRQFSIRSVNGYLDLPGAFRHADIHAAPSLAQMQRDIPGNRLGRGFRRLCLECTSHV